MKPIVLRVEQSIIHPCVAKPGDLLVIRPGDERPVVLQRDVIPNYGALLGHLASGALSPLGDPDDDAYAVLLAAQADPPHPPPPPHPERRREA